MAIKDVNEKIDKLQAKVLVEQARYDNPYTRKATLVALAVGFIGGVIVGSCF